MSNLGDLVKTKSGYLANKRWVNEDGTLKTGLELEKEKIRVELEDIARRLLKIAKDEAL